MWTQREMQAFLLFAVEGATHNIHLDFAIVRALFADLCAEDVTLNPAPPKENVPEPKLNVDTNMSRTESLKGEARIDHSPVSTKSTAGTDAKKAKAPLGPKKVDSNVPPEFKNQSEVWA
jgi:hypothetical protein